MAATDYDFSETRTQIIEGALRKVGAFGFGGSVSGEEMVNAANALNEMIKEWQSENIYLWQLQVVTVTTTANVASVALPTDPGILFIDQAAWVNGTEHTHVEIISWRNYQAITSKADQGNPELIAVDKVRNPTAYLYPVATSAVTLRLLCVTKLKDWDTTTTNGDFPEHWMLALKYGLASLLADDYTLPLAERKALENKAEYFFLRAKGSDKDRQDLVVVKGSY